MVLDRSSFSILTAHLLTPPVQPLFNKFTPVPEGEVRTRVEALAAELKFPLKHLYVIDGSKRSSHSNAYFYGLPWSKQIVLYDTLLEKSTPAEVEAVLAHELGHWYFGTLAVGSVGSELTPSPPLAPAHDRAGTHALHSDHLLNLHPQ